MQYVSTTLEVSTAQLEDRKIPNGYIVVYCKTDFTIISQPNAVIILTVYSAGQTPCESRPNRSRNRQC